MSALPPPQSSRSGSHATRSGTRKNRRTALAVDIGGTFTDIVLAHAGRQFTGKVLTTPHAPEDGVLQGITEILDAAGLPAIRIDLFTLGTTLATNALIERKGARTAMIATEGFTDLVEIGQESRFAQYDVFLEKPPPLVPRDLRFGIPERIDVHGNVLRPLDERAVAAVADTLARSKVESVAVVLLHSYVNPAHERRVREILKRQLPELWLTLSCEVCPEIREYERMSTSCANAYVQPLVAGYLNRLRKRLHALGMRCPFFLMTSGGAITTVDLGAEQPIRLVESGPAGGAILAREVARQCGVTRALSFDMGGTTAKICYIDDYQPQISRSFEFGRVYRFMKGSGLPIRIPVIEMVEIGAGGGSIARIDAMKRVQVGPDSAGAEPGPACYGRGGKQATVTDANVVLGLLDSERFAAGKVRLDVTRAEQAIATDVAGPLGAAPMVGAMAVSEMVTENMANAARVHAMELGKQPEDYTLIAFGGAAPLHAAQLAAKLGIGCVLIPKAASVGSAVGFLWAPVAFQAVRSFYQRIDRFDHVRVTRLLRELAVDAQRVVQAGAPGERHHTKRVAYMRYIGQGHEIPIELPPGALGAASPVALKERFEAHYRTLYGRTIPGLDVEVMNWTVTVATAGRPPRRARAAGRPTTPPRKRSVRMFDLGALVLRDVPVFDRGQLAVDAVVMGPALIAEDQTTTVVSAGFRARINSLGCIVLERVRRSRQ
ncbi:MAG: hydantoinase/oxoprolinase family protein [Burkholderiales bacterium]|nr:hydantoinase/oxoprolinase family protein [Burkholderiales bacterium]